MEIEEGHLVSVLKGEQRRGFVHDVDDCAPESELGLRHLLGGDRNRPGRHNHGRVIEVRFLCACDDLESFGEERLCRAGRGGQAVEQRNQLTKLENLRICLFGNFECVDRKEMFTVSS